MSHPTDDLQRQFTAHGLAAYWPAISRLLQPCLHLTYAPAPDEQLAPGTSKLGGHPDLPRSLAWPTLAGLPLTFVAQLNLRDLPASAVRPLLPATGLLSFFYRAADDDAGASPHAVLWTSDNSTELVRQTPPQPWPAGELQYPAARITAFENRPSLPSGESEEAVALFLGPNPEQATPTQYASRSAYWRLAEPDTPGDQANQLFGYPAHADGTLELICECVATGDPTLRQLPTFTPAQREALRHKWVLLLQVASNPDLDMYFGADMDYFYFWISRADLARHDFSRTIAFSVH